LFLVLENREIAQFYKILKHNRLSLNNKAKYHRTTFANLDTLNGSALYEWNYVTCWNGLFSDI